MLVVLNWMNSFWDFVMALPEMQRHFSEMMLLIAVGAIPVALPIGLMYLLWKHTRFILITICLLVAGWVIGTMIGAVLCIAWNAAAGFFLLPTLTADLIYQQQNLGAVIMTVYLLFTGWRDWVKLKAKH